MSKPIVVKLILHFWSKLVPQLLITSVLYTRIFKGSTLQLLKENRSFLQSMVEDNCYILEDALLAEIRGQGYRLSTEVSSSMFAKVIRKVLSAHFINQRDRKDNMNLTLYLIGFQCFYKLLREAFCSLYMTQFLYAKKPDCEEYTELTLDELLFSLSNIRRRNPLRLPQDILYTRKSRHLQKSYGTRITQSVYPSNTKEIDNCLAIEKALSLQVHPLSHYSSSLVSSLQKTLNQMSQHQLHSKQQ